VISREEGGDDVKSSWPLRAGLHTCYNGGDSGQRDREVELISKSHEAGNHGRVSDWGEVVTR